jgi:uncharacterized protein (DUF3084 family)
MVIAGLTLGTLLAVSSSLREALLRGERLVRENENYQLKNKDLHYENVRLTSISTRLSKEVKDKSKEVQIAQKEADDALKARDEVRKRVLTLQTEISSKKNELIELRRTGRLTESQLKQISASLDGRMRELKEKKNELAVKNSELATKQQALLTKTDELSSKMVELDAADKRIQEIDKRRRTAEGAIKEREALIQQQQMYLQRAVRLTDLLLTGDVVIQQGQEIGRKVIDCKQPAEKVREDLITLLDSANARAAKSQAGSRSRSRAIRLVFVDRTTGRIVDDENDCIDHAVKTIVRQGQENPAGGVIARIVVVNNTLKDDIAPVEINLFVNNLSFHRGEKIASRNIDGKMSEGRILVSVMDFLQQSVRSAAQSAGVVPVASPNPEEVGEPLSGKQLDELMELVGKIRSENKLIELHAKARKDIYAVGPLDMDSIQFTISEPVSASR